MIVSETVKDNTPLISVVEKLKCMKYIGWVACLIWKWYKDHEKFSDVCFLTLISNSARGLTFLIGINITPVQNMR